MSASADGDAKAKAQCVQFKKFDDAIDNFEKIQKVIKDRKAKYTRAMLMGDCDSEKDRSEEL